MGALTLKHYEDTRLRAIARFCQGRSSLDLGYAQAPNPYLEAGLTTGVDLNPNTKSTRYARELVGDILEIGSVVKGLRFQNVIAGELIEHLENPYDFLRSLHPLLYDDGQVIISTPNPVAWPTLLFEWTQSKRFFYTEEHKYYFPPRWVKRMFEHCGYRLTAARGVGLWLPGVVLPCPSSFSYQVIYVARPK